MIGYQDIMKSYHGEGSE